MFPPTKEFSRVTKRFPTTPWQGFVSPNQDTINSTNTALKSSLRASRKLVSKFPLCVVIPWKNKVEFFCIVNRLDNQPNGTYGVA
jgi:hypothetical protein